MLSREDIIRLREQSDDWAEDHLQCKGEYHPDFHTVSDERFAALVAAQEREACAKVCDVRCVEDGWEGGYADECAAEIRARGQEMERKPANAHDKVYSEVELANAYQKGWNDAMLRSSLGMARGQA